MILKFANLLAKTRTDIEALAWTTFVSVSKYFLGNCKAENYKDLGQNMIVDFNRMGDNMSIIVHCLYSH